MNGQHRQALRWSRRARTALDDGTRAGFIALGFFFVFLGIVGAFVPLMPTTIFLILSAWCFGRSSPRFEAWMLNHPRFGRALRDWREHGAMPVRAKLMACCGMAFGYVLFCLVAKPVLWLALVVATVLLLCAAWIIARPRPPSDQRPATQESKQSQGGRQC
ncbi:DUF454 domain-containing protein [Kosakonia cowanii]|nr:DUF454 domain-containing protein [Kosakonia cowanii]